MTVQDIMDWFQALAPLELAEDWDNVGLLLGDAEAPVERVVTCLTLTPDVAAAAIEDGVDIIIAHHPILFRPVQRITSGDAQGRMVLALIEAGISVYAPHTAFDSAERGINSQLALLFGLINIQPIRPAETAMLGGGRFGDLLQPTTLAEFSKVVRDTLGAPQLAYVGDPQHVVRRVGIACGAAAEFLRDAQRRGCDVLLTGEARFHACLEARESGIGLIIAGHYQTERPAVEQLARELQSAFPELLVTPSTVETDPLLWT